jgi:Ca-activated chloride channel family protein
VAADFVRRRETDRIGLVIFAGEAYSPCPLTVDRGVLLEILDNLKVGVLQDGTAIGMGLATAVNRIQSSVAKSKIIILMTDGVNNRGYYSPAQAMELAKGLGIKIYTIGVGSRGEALSPVGLRDGQYIFAPQPVEIDEELLLKIAQTTGGNYYRATSASELEKIYSQIDQLEKSKIDYTAYRRKTEAFGGWVLAAMCCIILELLLRYTIFRTIP